MMAALAAVEVILVFGGVVLFIWRLQYTFPDFAAILLTAILMTFVIHRDRLADLGLGSRGFLKATKSLAVPTLVIASILIAVAPAGLLTLVKLEGFGKYFAWCLLQEFTLQSFFASRLLLVLKDPKRTAWINAAMFAAVHIPNPVLIPVTLLGGYVLTRVFISTRNLMPLALAQAVVGSLLAVALPASWHHGLRVGPGYYG